MAQIRYQRTAYKSGGASASQRVSYITRQPVREFSSGDERLAYLHDARREDLVYATHRNLPAWAQDDPHVFFRAAEQYERGAGAGKWAGVAFEEWKVSLPVEFDHRQNMALQRDLVDAIAGDTLPCVVAFHAPRTMDDTQQQPHLHLLLSARKTDAIDRTPAQHFRRYNPDHPERGGAQKDRAFAHKGAVKAHRVLIADTLNVHLEQHGLAARVHPDTLKDRELDREPEPKLLPSESRAYRDHGTLSETMQQVLAIRAQRAAQAEREQANASTYWEHRKRTLGLTPDRSLPQQMDRITDARAQTMTQAPAPAARSQSPVRTQARTPEDARHQRIIARHQRQHDRRHHIRQQQERSVDPTGGSFNIRLHDEKEWHERDQSQGRG
jgi:hypothetical protein